MRYRRQHQRHQNTFLPCIASYTFRFLNNNDHRPPLSPTHAKCPSRIMPRRTVKNSSGDKPLYSQSRTAIASRKRRAAKKAEASRRCSSDGETPAAKRKMPVVDLEIQQADIKQEISPLRSPERARGAASAHSLARNAPKKRVMPGGYSQTKTAIASRERRAKMTPKVRRELLKRQANYNAVKRAQNTTENEEGSEDLSDIEQQSFPGNEEAPVTQKRYVVVTSIPSSPSNALTVPMKATPNHRLPKDVPLGQRNLVYVSRKEHQVLIRPRQRVETSQARSKASTLNPPWIPRSTGV